MKRSEIDRIIDKNIALLKQWPYSLPPQAYWNLSKWLDNRDSTSEMARRGIGWYLTDWGSGDFSKIGLLMYTISNGVIDQQTKKPLDQPYAQKLLISEAGQITPTHHHRSKREDIIVLGGGDLEVKLNNVGHDELLDTENDVKILRNNAWAVCPAGTTIKLSPGERIRVDQHHYHKFWGDRSTVLIEEVSTVNDDEADNCFLPEDKVSFFIDIEEDQEPKYLLCNELPGSEKFAQLVKQYLV